MSETPLFRRSEHITHLVGPITNDTHDPLLRYVEGLGQDTVAASTHGYWTILGTGLAVLEIANNGEFSAQLNALLNANDLRELLGCEPRGDWHSHRCDAWSTYFGPEGVQQSYERATIAGLVTEPDSDTEHGNNEFGYLTANVTKPGDRRQPYVVEPIGPVLMQKESETLRASGSIERFNSHELHRDASAPHTPLNRAGFNAAY